MMDEKFICESATGVIERNRKLGLSAEAAARVNGHDIATELSELQYPASGIYKTALNNESTAVSPEVQVKKTIEKPRLVVTSPWSAPTRKEAAMKIVRAYDGKIRAMDGSITRASGADASPYFENGKPTPLWQCTTGFMDLPSEVMHNILSWSAYQSIPLMAEEEGLAHYW